MRDQQRSQLRIPQCVPILRINNPGMMRSNPCDCSVGALLSASRLGRTVRVYAGLGSRGAVLAQVARAKEWALCLSATGRLSARTAVRNSCFPPASKRFISNVGLSNPHVARVAVLRGGKHVRCPTTAARLREASDSSSPQSAPNAASKRWCRSSHVTVDRFIAATAISGCASFSDSALSHGPRIDRPLEPDRSC